MKIELTTEQHAALMEHLNDYSELLYHEAASFVRLGEIGRELADKRIQQARSAFDLFMALARC